MPGTLVLMGRNSPRISLGASSLALGLSTLVPIGIAVAILLSIVVTIFMDQISKVWELLLTLGAGTGLVYILRWYWWRVNAWSEIAAMVAPALRNP